VDTGLDALAVELYVTIDDLLEARPEQGPPRPAGGFAVQIGDAELLTLAVMASMLQFTSERRWLRHANARLRHLFPYLPQEPGYNKRLRKLAATMAWLTGQLGARVSVADDDVWVADSTPVECGRSRELSVQTWPGGPNTVTAQAISATSGGCGYPWSLPCMGYRWAGH